MYSDSFSGGDLWGSGHSDSYDLVCGTDFG